MRLTRNRVIPSTQESSNRSNVFLFVLVSLTAFWVTTTAGQIIFNDGFENIPPMIISKPVTKGEVGLLYEYDVDANGDMLTYYFLESPEGMTIDENTGEIEWTPTIGGNHPVTVEVADGNNGFDQQSWIVDVLSTPKPVPSEIDPTVMAPFPELFDFIYAGPDAIQMDVQEGAIEEHRVAILRGIVTDRDGLPLRGAKISVLRDEPVGHTLTRANGGYDIAVNGGGEVVIQVELDGYFTVQRNPRVPWNEIRVLDPIRLVQPSTTVTEVMFSPTDPQVAMGDMETDADGPRQGLLLFRPNTTAELHMPDETIMPISTMNVRITEFTVGPNGPQAMPAELPPTTGYTYAAEYSIDEVEAMGAESVHFDPPVVSYTDNFVGFPVGAIVPTASFNRLTGAWEGSLDGRVIKIVEINLGVAELDLDGDDVADDPGILGIEISELEELASLYLVGTQLWRVEVPHFSPWDHNWPFGPPDGAGPPDPDDGPRDDGPDPSKNCPEPGFSIIECESQHVIESIPIVGTGQSLHFASDRAESYVAGRKLEVNIPAANLPPQIANVYISFEIAGTKEERIVDAMFDIEETFVWDGLDAYGRELIGPQPYLMKIGYVFDGAYSSGNGSGAANETQSFFSQPGVAITGDRAAGQVTLLREFRGFLQIKLNGFADLGGWSFTDHHTSAPGGTKLYLGNGEAHELSDSGSIGVLYTWDCKLGSCPNGPAEGANINERSIAIIKAVPLSDGSVVANIAGSGLWRIRPDETLEEINGDTSWDYDHLSVMPDDSLIFTDNDDSDKLVYRLEIGGMPELVFGGGTTEIPFTNPDYVGPALGALVEGNRRVYSLAAGPDGSFYVQIYQSFRSSIWHVSPDGITQRVAGVNFEAPIGNGGPALDAEIGAFADSLAVDSQGNILIADSANRQIRKVSNGIIERVIGSGDNACTDPIPVGPALTTPLCNPVHIALANDGLVFIYSTSGPFNLDEVIFVSDFKDFGLYAGAQPAPWNPPSDGGNPLQTRLDGLQGAFFRMPDGTVVLTRITSYAAVHVRPNAVQLSLGLPGNVVPSQDGRYLYVFSIGGRHVQTHDTFLARTVRTFDYDGEGRLVGMTDADDRTTTIERDVNGVATAIVGPDGHTTQLTITAGKLMQIDGPQVPPWQMGYDGNGALETVSDPRGHTSTFMYDADGRLEMATNRTGGVITLARSSLGRDRYEVVVTANAMDTRTYRVETEGTDLVRTTIDPSGATTTVRRRADGTTEANLPDGRTVTYTITPDSRFAGQAFQATSLHIESPDGVSTTVNSTIEVVLSTPNDPLSMTDWTETQVHDGRTWVHHYDVATRTLEVTSPEGTVETTEYDDAGRVVSFGVGGGIAPLLYSYDAAGRLSTFTQANETVTYTYDGDGNLVTLTDDDGNDVTWTHDAAGRILSVTTQENRSFDFTLDNNGNRTQVESPENHVHTLAFDFSDRLSSYTAPGSAALQLGFDGLGRRSGVTYPDATIRTDTVVDNKVGDSTLPEAVLGIEYSPEIDAGPGTTRNINLLTRDPDSRPEQALAFVLDGSLIMGQTMTGTAAATVTYTYEVPYEVATRTLDAEPPVAFTYNDDSLLTGIGPFTLTRDGATGYQENISDGVLDLDIGLDTRAQLLIRDLEHNLTNLYSLTLIRNDRSMVINRMELADGVGTERNYEYDLDGRLVEVADELDAVVESFIYDDDGNRLSHTTSMGTAMATYTTGDQLISRAGIAYGYDANGFLATRGADTFDYTADGILQTATVGGVVVTYDYDYYGRRVARTDVGGTTVYVYGDLNHSFRVTASIAPDSTVTEYLYDDSNVLFAFARDSSWYYVAADQLGSPRVVVEASSGNAVKVISYSAYGVVLSDSNAAFILPIGFAGGLADPTTDLVRFGVRDYEPAAARFTGRDPLLLGGGSSNLYMYVDNEPIDHRDYTGLLKIGASLYDGVGGGGSVIVTTKGIAFCLEGGVGLGGGLGVDLTADLPKKGEISIVIEGGVGPLSTGIDIPLTGGCNSAGSEEGDESAAKWDGLTISTDAGLGKHLKLKPDAKIQANASLRGCSPPLVW